MYGSARHSNFRCASVVQDYLRALRLRQDDRALLGELYRR